MRQGTKEWLKQAQEKPVVERIVYDFLKAIDSQGIIVDRAFLFGSNARGEAREESDIDIIVISKDFSQMPYWRRWKISGKAAAQPMEPVEALAYAPEEIEDYNLREGNFIRHILSQPETIEYQVGQAT